MNASPPASSTELIYSPDILKSTPAPIATPENTAIRVIRGKKVALPVDFDEDRSLYRPHGKWEWASGREIMSSDPGSRLGYGLEGTVKLKVGQINDEEIIYISKLFSVWDRWTLLFSYLYLNASSKYLRPLQGVCVPWIIGVFHCNGGLIGVAQDLPHPTGWREADAFLEDKQKEAVIDAYQKLHERDILHGDAEYRHWLIGDDGKATIIDFGFSRVVRPDEGAEKAEVQSCTRRTISDEMRKVKFMLNYKDSREKELELARIREERQKEHRAKKSARRIVNNRVIITPLPPLDFIEEERAAGMPALTLRELNDWMSGDQWIAHRFEVVRSEGRAEIRKIPVPHPSTPKDPVDSLLPTTSSPVPNLNPARVSSDAPKPSPVPQVDKGEHINIVRADQPSTKLDEPSQPVNGAIPVKSKASTSFKRPHEQEDSDDEESNMNPDWITWEERVALFKAKVAARRNGQPDSEDEDSIMGPEWITREEREALANGKTVAGSRGKKRYKREEPVRKADDEDSNMNPDGIACEERGAGKGTAGRGDGRYHEREEPVRKRQRRSEELAAPTPKTIVPKVGNSQTRSLARSQSFLSLDLTLGPSKDHASSHNPYVLSGGGKPAVDEPSTKTMPPKVGNSQSPSLARSQSFFSLESSLGSSEDDASTVNPYVLSDGEEPAVDEPNAKRRVAVLKSWALFCNARDELQRIQSQVDGLVARAEQHRHDLLRTLLGVSEEQRQSLLNVIEQPDSLSILDLFPNRPSQPAPPDSTEVLQRRRAQLIRSTTHSRAIRRPWRPKIEYPRVADIKRAARSGYAPRVPSKLGPSAQKPARAQASSIPASSSRLTPPDGAPGPSPEAKATRLEQYKLAMMRRARLEEEREKAESSLHSASSNMQTSARPTAASPSESTTSGVKSIEDGSPPGNSVVEDEVVQPIAWGTSFDANVPYPMGDSENAPPPESASGNIGQQGDDDASESGTKDGLGKRKREEPDEDTKPNAKKSKIGCGMM